jgi:hypothetical protein
VSLACCSSPVNRRLPSPPPQAPVDWKDFRERFFDGEEAFFTKWHNGSYRNKHAADAVVPFPRYAFFQNAKAWFGTTRYYGNSDESFRRASELVLEALQPLGFREISDYLLTDGKFEGCADGLHYR